MATYIPTTAFIPTFLDDNGNLLSGGTIEAFISGTSTPTAMFTDESGTSAGDTITLNARGEPETSGASHQIWINTAVKYDFILKDSEGNTVNSPASVASPLIGAVASSVTVAAAKALTTLTDGQALYVQGTTAAGDGGGGVYYYDASSTATGDDGKVLDLDTLTGRLLLQDQVTPQTYNAAGDGTTNEDGEFSTLEGTVTGEVIDLGSATYLVTSIPTANTYINGTWKIGSIDYPALDNPVQYSATDTQ